jgi:hypothetical protein
VLLGDPHSAPPDRAVLAPAPIPADRLPASTVPSHKGNTVPAHRNYYSGESQRWVAEMFRPDLEAFGYGFDD